jgi:thymidine kinase
MAKLYFRHGAVGSAKTLNLLAVAHNYRQQGKEVLLVKPELDTRFGLDIIKTRAGLEMPADVLAPLVGTIPLPALNATACVLVDEAQFLDPIAIDQLRNISCGDSISGPAGVPVICYGLRTDFRRQMFPASRRLMELADSIEEVKTTCHFCLRKAVFNLKLLNGVPTLSGPAVELGCEETYLPTCAACYESQHHDAGRIYISTNAGKH